LQIEITWLDGIWNRNHNAESGHTLGPTGH